MASRTILNPNRNYPSVFEPIHGSAPDNVGEGIANFLAVNWSSAMMLEISGEGEAADLIPSAIITVTRQSRVLTPDMGGSASTNDVTQEILMKMEELN